MINEELLKHVKDNQSDYEIRMGFYGALIISSKQIEMIKFDFAMKEHYRIQKEDHELLMHSLNTRGLMSNKVILAYVFFIAGSVIALNLMNVFVSMFL